MNTTMNSNQMLELISKVDEMWFSYKFDEIWTYLMFPFGIIGLIALYKINQVLKIYIEENKDFL